MFTCHFNLLECFMLFLNNNIHLHCVNVAQLPQPSCFLCCGHRGYMLCLLFSSHVFRVSLRSLTVQGFLDEKCLFYCFLFIFQSFEVRINSNAVKNDCQARVQQMTMNEQSTNNGLMTHWFYWVFLKNIFLLQWETN